MEDHTDPYAQLVEWLQQRGHTEEEIDKILDRVREYDERTGVDSVMDSIASGRLNLSAIIDEALRK